MDAFNLTAFLKLNKDDYEEGLDEAKSEGSSFGSALATGAKIGIGALTAVGTAVAGASTAIAKLSSQSVDAYADYEQLVGGIETLFTDTAGNTEAVTQMMENASNAWRTAGLSANEYMETAIESSAAMVSAVGGDTEEAARLMDMSITDMADNVNKMGTTMESIQNAYRGFSRGNFTMLDNLALGFAGTKDGMQELLDKAQEFSGIEYDIESYADIVQAIHVVQEEMGIAGTTAKEANETISGSLASMKSAWENLITGFSDPDADLGELIGNMVNAGTTYLDNLMPAIEQSISGIATLIDSAVPIIADKLPALINSILPSLVNAATQLVNSLVQALPSILGILLDQIPPLIQSVIPVLLGMLPQIIELGVQFVIALMNGIADSLPTIIPILVDVVGQIVEVILDHLDEFIDAGIAIIEGVVDGIVKALPVLINGTVKLITKLVQRLPEIITLVVQALPDLVGMIADGLITGLPMLIDGAITLVIELVKNLPMIISSLIQAIPDIILAILTAFAPIGAGLVEVFGMAFDGILEWWDGVVAWFQELGQQIAEFFQPAIDAVTNIVNTVLDIWNSFIETISPLIEAIRYLFETIFMAIQIINERIWTAISNKITEVWNAIVGFLTPILTTIHDFISNTFDKIKNFITSTWDGIKANIQAVLDFIKNIVSSAFNALYSLIEEPLNEAHEMIGNIFSAIGDTISNLISGAKNWGHDLIDNFVGGIKDKINSVSETITDVADTIRSIIGFSEPEKGPLSDFHLFAPDMIDLFTSGLEAGRKQIESTMNDVLSLPVVDAKDNMAYNSSSGSANSEDIMSAVMNALSGLVVQVNVGNEALDGMITKSIQRTAYVSGGRG